MCGSKKRSRKACELPYFALHRRVKVGKADCSVDTFIGAPFGAVYELEEDGRTLRRCAK